MAQGVADQGVGRVDEITRQDVMWTYRIMLGREPENEAAVEHALSHGSRERLLQAVLDSVEFRAWHGTESSRLPLNRPRLDIEWDTDTATLTNLIDHVSATWRGLGEERPHWSVLTMDQFLPENINASEEAFYASGKGELERLVATIERQGRSPDGFETIFEYGCGLGRTTMHLANRFPQILTCDISSKHLELAAARAQHCRVANITFREARTPNFGMLEPFDLWFSQIVLQHNSPPIIAMILRRAMGMLNPGGLAVFQIPTYSPGYRFRVADYASNLQPAGMEMHVLPQPVIFQIASEAGCIPLEVSEDDATGSPLWLSNSFVFAKPGRVTRDDSPPPRKGMASILEWLPHGHR
jgi:SAM-dependent methyltransferase